MIGLNRRIGKKQKQWWEHSHLTSPPIKIEEKGMKGTFDTVNVQIIFEIIYCAECGVGMALPQVVIANRMKDGKTFYCPNGHKNLFVTESKER